MSDSIVPCNSSYCSLEIAPQSSRECHFCNWSIHSDRMLTLRPGDATNMLEVVVEDDGGHNDESDDASGDLDGG